MIKVCLRQHRQQFKKQLELKTNKRKTAKGKISIIRPIPFVQMRISVSSKTKWRPKLYLPHHRCARRTRPFFCPPPGPRCN